MRWSFGEARSRSCAENPDTKPTSPQGLQDSPLSPIAAINRRITDPVTGRYGLPDARLGANLYADTTLAYKPPGSEQIRNWHAIRPGHYLIIRPNFLGDSYVISPDSIRPPPYITRKPGI